VRRMHAYLTGMTFGHWPIALAVASALLVAVPARAQSDNERYNIMKPEPGTANKNSRSRSKDNPEPWLTPKYQSPRGTRQQVTTPKAVPSPKSQGSTVPPLLYVPQTGRTLPNLPSPTGSETAQDRAARCAHQAGVYGQAAGDRTGYINTCINQ